MTQINPRRFIKCFATGQFTGKYKPGAFGFGIIESFIEVDIMGAGSGGYPALSFTLEAKQGEDSDFATFAVKNGCMIGSANAYGTNNPFVGLISGKVGEGADYRQSAALRASALSRRQAPARRCAPRGRPSR